MVWRGDLTPHGIRCQREYTVYVQEKRGLFFEKSQ